MVAKSKTKVGAGTAKKGGAALPVSIVTVSSILACLDEVGMHKPGEVTHVEPDTARIWTNCLRVALQRPFPTVMLGHCVEAASAAGGLHWFGERCMTDPPCVKASRADTKRFQDFFVKVSK